MAEPARRDGPPATPGSRQLTPKALATRARLVELAADVFAAEGYAAASVRDLARRSGLSSGAIYGTFRGKAELLAAAVETSIAADLEALPDAVIASELPEIDAYQFATFDDPRRVRLRALLLEAAIAARADPEVREQLRATVNGRLQSWTTAHEEWAAERGVDSSIDTHALVTMLVAIDLGLGVLDALGADLPEPGALATLVATVLRGLEGSPEGGRQ